MMCAVAPDMAGQPAPTWTERAAKVRVAGLRAVAEASLANSFPVFASGGASSLSRHLPWQRPVAYAELSAALGRLEMTAADWGAIRAPVLGGVRRE